MINSKKNIQNIFKILHQNNPNPETELEFTNNYTLLVAVILSARATDKSVNKATEELFKKYDSPEKMLELGEEGLKQYINTIGLYNSKAKNIISTSYDLVNRFNSKVPSNLNELESLAGVGRKTANVILSCAFGKTAIAVDTHVSRCSRRLGLTENKKPEEIESDLMKIIPKKYKFHGHHLLVLHGRYVCKSRNPLCQTCIIKEFCPSKLSL